MPTEANALIPSHSAFEYLPGDLPIATLLLDAEWHSDAGVLSRNLCPSLPCNISQEIYRI